MKTLAEYVQSYLADNYIDPITNQYVYTPLKKAAIGLPVVYLAYKSGTRAVSGDFDTWQAGALTAIVLALATYKYQEYRKAKIEEAKLIEAEKNSLYNRFWGALGYNIDTDEPEEVTEEETDEAKSEPDPDNSLFEGFADLLWSRESEEEESPKIESEEELRDTSSSNPLQSVTPSNSSEKPANEANDSYCPEVIRFSRASSGNSAENQAIVGVNIAGNTMQINRCKSTKCCTIS